VSLGLIVRVWLGTRAAWAIEYFPLLSVVVIALIVACVVALVRGQLATALGITGLLVVLHNSLGLAAGYSLATLFRLPREARRTIAIEVGMQNSGLGVALARTFIDLPLAMLPASLFSVWHNVSGSFLASIWRRTV
jgi:bile acid:Na+ symporter, BASS family